MKKILFITMLSPFETKSGAHQRTWQIYNVLCEKSDVSLICFGADQPNPPEKARGDIVFWGNEINIARKTIKDVLFFWKKEFLHPRNQKWAEIVQSELQKTDYDIIFVRYIQIAIAAGVPLDKKVIIDADDLPEEHLRSAARSSACSWLRKVYFRFAAHIARWHTRSIAKKCQKVLLAYKNQSGFTGFSWLPNLPLPPAENSLKEVILPEKIVFFVGLLSYPPNFEGLGRFLTEIWPKILEKHPDARLRVAGHGLPAEQREKWRKIRQVELLGFVSDLVAEYNQCRAVIVPIYTGSGTNIKVLEAMQMGRPCVITNFAAKGFETLLQDGKNILIAQNDAEFAHKLQKLLENPDFSAQIAHSAQSDIQTHLNAISYSAILSKFL